LWVLKTKKALPGTLDWKDIDTSEFRIIHEMPQIKTAIPGKLQKGEKLGVFN
jgi:hypothetical protein